MARSWDEVKGDGATAGLDEARAAEIMAEMRDQVRADEFADIGRSWRPAAQG
jgi:hypothetical protein